MIGIVAAIALIYLLGLAAFCPGLALLWLARRAGWPLLPSLVALLLLIAPLAVLAAAPGSVGAGIGESVNELSYLLWFFPGLLVLIDSVAVRGERLGPKLGLLALAPYLLFLVASALLGTGAVGGPLASCAAAVLVLLLLRAPDYRLPARLIAVGLLLLPIALPLSLRLPDHLAMADACETKAGARLAAAAAPLREIALELGERGCGGICTAFLAGGDIEAVESPGDPLGVDGARRGLQRYRLAPADAAEPAETCVRKIRLQSGELCLMARPIEAYGVDYLLRFRGEPPSAAAVTQRAYEIFDMTRGDVVVWTSAYFMPHSEHRAFFDVPLRLLLTPRTRCETNGPPLEALIERFLDTS